MVIPATGKETSVNKCGKNQETKHITSDSYFKQTLSKTKHYIEKEGYTKSTSKKTAAFLTSRASLQTFTKRVMKRIHVHSVAGSTVQKILCKTVNGSGARSVKGAIMKCALGLQAESSSHVRNAYDSAA